MSWLAPALLFGTGLAVVPLIVHLVGRHRTARVPFAALDFLLRANKTLARRLRFRQRLLLLLRTALVVALALMMAKPVWEVASGLPALHLGKQSVVLIIDDTPSMRRVAGQVTLLVRAKQRARELLRTIAAGSEVAVLSVSDPSGPLALLSRDRRRAWAALERLQPGFRPATLAPALEQALRLLQEEAPVGGLVLVLSDLAAHGLPAALPAWPSSVALHPIDVAAGLPRGNRAVVELSAAPSGAPGRRSMRLSARVCNFARVPSRTPVFLLIDGRRLAQGELALAAGGCAYQHFQHSFAQGGAHEVAVALAPDALTFDDVRYLRVEVAGEVRMLLVNGDPSPVRQRDELFYLQAALAADGGDRQRVVARAVRADDFDARQLAAFDAVALCNVRALAAAQLVALQRYVVGGGGLLIAVGDAVEAERYNAMFGGLLPQPLRGVTSATAEAASELHLGALDAEHPLVASLAREPGGAGLARVRVRRAFRLEPSPRGGQRAVLRYDDGSPALVEAPLGAGRVLLWTTTIDRDWTDLPIRPGFLPLMQQVARYLGRAPLAGAHHDVTVGMRSEVTPPPGTTELRLRIAPEGATRRWGGAALRGGRVIEVLADQPGFYRLSAVVGDEVRPLQNESFAANVDLAESQLAAGTLPARAARGGATAGPARQQIELWHAVGLLALLLLLGESWLTRRG